MVEQIAPDSVSNQDGIRAWLEGNSRHVPDKIFIESVDQEKSISHGAMSLLCRQIAHYLDSRDIKANDRVALLAGNSLEHLAVEAHLASRDGGGQPSRSRPDDHDISHPVRR